jgi:hypothetical protein
MDSMENQKESTAPDDSNAHLALLATCLEKQSETIARLTEAVNNLSASISVNTPRVDLRRTHQDQLPLKWFYRAWSFQSRAKTDQDHNNCSGNPDWLLDTYDDISLHFAEFHSDGDNKKDTSLISATNDPIRALKKAFLAGNFETRDDNTVFFSIIYSSEFYIARDLIDNVVKPPLCHLLSKEALRRLKDNKYLHDSEVVFLHKIPQADIKFQMTLHELYNRGLRKLLPELKEKDDYCNRYIWPKRIRERISDNCSCNSVKIAKRLKEIFCMITQDDNGPTVESLKTAQSIVDDDQYISAEVREHVVRILYEQQDKLSQQLPRSKRPQHVGFADDGPGAAQA